MKTLFARLQCLFGFHTKGRWFIRIVEVRRESHAIEYIQEYCCERCEKIIPEPIDNK